MVSYNSLKPLNIDADVLISINPGVGLKAEISKHTKLQYEYKFECWTTRGWTRTRARTGFKPPYFLIEVLIGRTCNWIISIALTFLKYFSYLFVMYLERIQFLMHFALFNKFCYSLPPGITIDFRVFWSIRWKEG